jgi:hypothetical protein
MTDIDSLQIKIIKKVIKKLKEEVGQLDEAVIEAYTQAQIIERKQVATQTEIECAEKELEDLLHSPNEKKN